ncbi:MAG TPA: hypothetical protein VGO50_15160 [Pyrinomonadaceae bacterium]|jgi:hypothetical protein|nr:hypothetical protein [Pyrinomonadaceae bacterium]
MSDAEIRLFGTIKAEEDDDPLFQEPNTEAPQEPNTVNYPEPNTYPEPDTDDHEPDTDTAQIELFGGIKAEEPCAPAPDTAEDSGQETD